jgi:hypothetical protein
MLGKSKICLKNEGFSLFLNLEIGLLSRVFENGRFLRRYKGKTSKVSCWPNPRICFNSYKFNTLTEYGRMTIYQ